MARGGAAKSVQKIFSSVCPTRPAPGDAFAASLFVPARAFPASSI